MLFSCQIYIIIVIFSHLNKSFINASFTTQTLVFKKLEFSKFQLIFKKCLCIAAFTVEPTVIAY
jgi:hypothetical protein